MINRIIPASFLCLLLVELVVSQCGAELVWWDGTREPGSTPPGKLLSDNIGYYGECVLSGVEYTYDTEPDVRPDKPKFERDRPGRLLLDGSPAQGVSRNGPIVVVFDFKRNCTFSEVGICTTSRSLSVELEVADKPGEYTTVYKQKVTLERPVSASTMHHFTDHIDRYPGAAMHRIRLPEKPKGQYLRLSVAAPKATSLTEVIAWGDAEVTQENPEHINPIAKPLAPQKWCEFSIPGIEKTGIVYNEYADWKSRIGEAGKLRAVWSQLSTWQNLSDTAIMPDKTEVNRPVKLVMARNETECAAVAFTNISWPDTIETTVKLGEFRRVSDGKPAPGIRGKLRAAGAIPSSIFGVVIGPLFEPDNIPALNVLKRYTTNTEGIHGFPNLNVPGMTSAILWLSVTTDGVEPGVYEADLSCSEPKTEPLTILAEVLDVTLPESFAWVVSYSTYTRMFPFEYGDRLEREAAYRSDIGLNVYHGFPEPGTVMEAARKHGNAVYGVICAPDKYRKMDLTDQEIHEIEAGVKQTVKRARELGLSYDEWYIELWDEPTKEALEAYENICEIMHRVDPNVRIYCNPMSYEIGKWYNKHIAVSCPKFSPRWVDGPEAKALFHQPRWTNGYYVVATNSAKGERTYVLERYRRFAWESMSRGWNGWGWFAYYQSVGDPWNDFDSECPDFLVAYPGPRGPIPTRHSEVAREAYEDYCLIDLLRQQGKTREVERLMEAYKDGVPLTDLRLRALRAAARK